MSKHRVIVDFDNTFHLEGCDVDDALALLYLMGCEDIEIVGICTTYGNNTLAAVHADTETLLSEWRINVPLLRGAENPIGAHHPQDAVNPASAFIADTLRANPGDVDVLATGSTTNLGQAEASAPGVLGLARSLTFMGGITESLAINGRIMDELNLSCDPDATLMAIGADTKKAIATAKNCLPAFFARQDFIARFGADSSLYAACSPWFDTMEEEYSWNGWTCWDVVAAAHIVHPELFESDEHQVTLYRRFFSVGYLECDRGDGAPASRIDLPRIKDAARFKEHVLDAWKRACTKLSLM